MDTYKQKMISYLKELSELIEEVTGFEGYINEEDIAEIEDNWSGDICRRYMTIVVPDSSDSMELFDWLRYGIRFCKLENAEKFNPWCVAFMALTEWPSYIRNDFVVCELCGYGKRHGICWKGNSDYNKIVELLLEKYGKEELPGLLELANKYFYGN